MFPATFSCRVPINKTGGRFKSPGSLQRCVETASQFLPMLKRGKYVPRFFKRLGSYDNVGR